MGSTASRPVPARLCTPWSCAGLCLCGLGILSRRLRRGSSVVASRPEPSPSFMKLDGVDLTDVRIEMNSLIAATNRELEEIRVLGSTVHPEFFNFVALQQNLRVLELKEVAVNGAVDLSFLMNLENLETLIMDDCHELTSSGMIHVLQKLPKLKRLVLGIERLTHLSEAFCASCTIELSLILYGPRCLNDASELKSIPNLVSLKFVDFWSLNYPLSIKDLSNLKSLSFIDGNVTAGHEKYCDVFPPSLENLACIGCHVDRKILDAMLYSGEHLVELELHLPHFSQDIAISCCPNLHVLRISAEECDDEILLQLSENKKLRVFELCGCQRLSPQHLSVFHTCQCLEKITISSSCMGPGACDQMASLSRLRCLEFHCCLGINLLELRNAQGLQRLVIDKCIDVQGNLNDFLESQMTQTLHSFCLEDFHHV